MCLPRNSPHGLFFSNHMAACCGHCSVASVMDVRCLQLQCVTVRVRWASLCVALSSTGLPETCVLPSTSLLAPALRGSLVGMRGERPVGQLLGVPPLGPTARTGLHSTAGAGTCLFPLPSPAQHVCFGFYFCCFSPRKVALLASSRNEQRRKGSRTALTLDSTHVGRTDSCRVALALPAVELDRATGLGDPRCGGSSVRLFLVDFSLELHVPHLVCEPAASLGLTQKLPVSPVDPSRWI